MRACCFVDKKGSREAKEDKKLALGVKRKQLKRKKDRVLECAVDSEPAAEHGVEEGNCMNFSLSFSSHFPYNCLSKIRTSSFSLQQ